jgi:hypothetical protein
MKYIKLFEDFNNYNYLYEYYNKSSDLSMGITGISKIISKGQSNWFTKEEIEQIRDYGRYIGIDSIGDSVNEDSKNFFGGEDGIGLRASVRNFFKGGDLCGKVNLNGHTISKKNGNFIIDGKFVVDSIQKIKMENLIPQFNN